MAIYDQEAEKAFLVEHKTALDFKSKASRFGLVAIILIVASGVTGFLYNMTWAMAPAVMALYFIFQSIASNMIATKISHFEEIAAAAEEEKKNAAEHRYISIIQAYADMLKSSSPLPGQVADEGKLSYKKRVIKEAIIWGIRNNQDADKHNQLKLAYMELKKWQHGVGDVDQALNASVGEGTLDVALLTPSTDKQKDEKKDWKSLVEYEEETLKRELRDADIR